VPQVHIAPDEGQSPDAEPRSDFHTLIHYKPPACAWLRVHIGYSARLVMRRSSEGKRKIKKKARLTCKFPDCFSEGSPWPGRMAWSYGPVCPDLRSSL
jgi:hypothetical protein